MSHTTMLEGEGCSVWTNRLDESYEMDGLDLEYLELEVQSLLKDVDDLKADEEALKHEVRDRRSHIKSLINEEDSEDREGEDDLKLSYDVFSFITVMPCSRASLFAFLVLFMQLFIYVASVFDGLLTDNEEDTLSPKPKFGVPRGIDQAVFLTQLLAILILFIVQQSLWEAIIYFLYIIPSDLDIGQKCLLGISNFLRLAESSFGTFVIFLLIIRSNNVVDLLKDFTAMTFVSDLDNTAFKLASGEFLGAHLYRATQKVREVTIHIKKSPTQHTELVEGQQEEEQPNDSSSSASVSRILKQSFTSVSTRTLLMTAILISILSAWITYFVLPQSRNEYLCKKLYIQLDDTIDPTLVYFSGNYSIVPGLNQLHSNPVRYTNTPNTDAAPTMTLRFCPNDAGYLSFGGVWIFTLLSFENNDQCNRDLASARSSVAEAEERFNFLDASLQWFVIYSKDGKVLPTKNIFFKCVDELNEPPINNNNNYCQSIQFDERSSSSPRVETRQIASKFTLLQNTTTGTPVTVYGRPTFVQSEIKNGANDVLFYLGKRWAITSTKLLDDFDENTMSLAHYLQYNFHPYLSNYSLDAFSQAVKAYTLKDKIGLPIDLFWYSVKDYTPDKSSENPKIYTVPDLSEQRQFQFLCPTCDNVTNPCFYNNTCLDNGTCHCSNGSRGALCQISPTHNGWCNPQFNTFEFDYDGGDCCFSTCTSNDDYDCGFDETGQYYIGYHLCYQETSTTPDYGHPWSSFIEKQLNFSSSSISSATADDEPIDNLALSQNGQVLVLRNRNLAVTVKDLLSTSISTGITRGFAIINTQDNNFGIEVQVSCEERSIVSSNNQKDDYGKLPPTTVAIRGLHQVYIYDWDPKSRSWIQHQKQHPISTYSQKIRRMFLKNNGNTLGIHYENGAYAIFKRQNRFSPWFTLPIGIHHDSPIMYPHISMSENDSLLLANTACLVYCPQISIKGCHFETFCSHDEILDIQISPLGTKFAILTKETNDYDELSIYDIYDKNSMNKRATIARNIPTSGHIKYFNEEGDQIILRQTSSPKKITLYYFDNTDQEWKFASDPHQESLIVATYSSYGVSALIIDDTESNRMERRSQSAFIRYPIKHTCPPSHSLYHFTLRLDDYPNELSWKIIQYSSTTSSRRNTKNNNSIPKKVLLEGGDYSESWITISDNVCISQTDIDSIGIQILDSGLDGLNTKAYAGLSVNGIVIWSTHGTDGYENEFIIPISSKATTTTVVEPLTTPSRNYNGTLHLLCETVECTWVKLSNQPFYDYSHYKRNSVILSHPLSISADGYIVAIGDHVRKAGRGQVSVFQYDFTHKTWNPMGDIISGNALGGHFGYSVSLSANGFIVASGAPDVSTEDNKRGIIAVFAYDTADKKWNPLGDKIHGNSFDDDNNPSFFGHSISLSAHGKILASGSDSPSGTICPAHIHHYSETEEKWISQGGCLGSNLDPADTKASHVRIAANGFIVAVAFPYSKSNNGLIHSGAVYMYEYNTASEEWYQLGDAIIGNNHEDKLGLSMSISSNGHTVAVAGLSKSPIKVFEYILDSQVWKQKGDDISSSNDHVYFHFRFLSLSSNGSILTVSDGYDMNFYSFSNEKRWQKLSQTLSITHDGIWRKPIPFASSADGITIIAGENGKINIFKKEYSTSPEACQDNHTPFKFNITTDEFPKDIIWRLDDDNGKPVINRQLGFSFDDNLKPVTKYTFTYCVPSPNDNWQSTYYRFVIEDTGEDGICCEMGNGTFDVYWDDKKVMDATNFKAYNYTYLPPSVELMHIQIEANITASLFEASVVNSRNVELLKLDIVNSTTYRTDDLVLPANECFIFQLVDFVHDAIGYIHLFFDNNPIKSYDLSTLVGIDRFEYGGNCNGLTCSSDDILFELDLMTGIAPEKISWTLMGPDNENLVSKIGYAIKFEQYHYQKCVPKTGCYIFSPFPFDGDFGYMFDLRIDGLLRKRVNFNDVHENATIHFGNCDQNMNQCSNGFMRLSMNILTDYWPSEFEWELVNQSNQTLEKSPPDMPMNAYLYQNICVPNDECLLMILTDRGEDGGTEVLMRWANTSSVTYGATIYTREEIYVGDCV